MYKKTPILHIVFLIALLSASFFPGKLMAQGYQRQRRAEPENKLSIGGLLGYSVFVMKDVNNGLRLLNGTIGSNYELIEGSVGFGGRIRYRYTSSVALSLGFEYLVTTTEGSGSGAITLDSPGPIGTYQVREKFTYKYTPISFGILLVNRDMTNDLGVGVELLYNLAVFNKEGKISGLEEIGGGNITYQTKFTGRAPGFRLFVMIERTIFPRFSIGLELGYRYARVDDLRDARGVETASPNFSGVYGNGGIFCHL